MSKQKLLTPDETTNQVCTVRVKYFSNTRWHKHRIHPLVNLTQPHALSPGCCLYLKSSGFHGVVFCCSTALFQVLWGNGGRWGSGASSASWQPDGKAVFQGVLSQPEPEEPSPLRQEAEEAGGGRDGVSHSAECCAAETAVINSGGASAEGLLGVGLQLSVICEWSRGTFAPPWPVGLCC